MLSNPVILIGLLLFFPILVSATDLIPSGQRISYPGGRAIFTCSNSENENIHWLINETLLETANFTNISSHSGGRIGLQYLLFSNIPLEYNATTIQCRAGSSSLSNVVILYLQGLLSAVGSLNITETNSTGLHLTWTSPFSFDIPTYIHDVTFCVNITVVDPISSTTNMTCGIIETEFYFPLPYRGLCKNYKFIVIPVNVVGYGERERVIFSRALIPPEYRGDHLVPESNVNEVYIYRMMMSAPVCDAHLVFIDLHEKEIITIESSNLTITDSSVVFTTEQLRKNRLYDVTIHAINVNGSATSDTRMSTHSIAQVNVVIPQNSSDIDITVNYFKQSKAKGAYLSFILTRNDGSIDFNRSVHHILNRNTSVDDYPLPLAQGRYLLYTYDIQGHGLLMDEVMYPASFTEFFMHRTAPESNRSTSAEIEDCNIFTAINVTGISALCTFASGSQATGFQMIVRSNELEEVDTLLIGRTNDLFTPVTIEVEENKTYFITIFPIKGERGIIDSLVVYTTEISLVYRPLTSDHYHRLTPTSTSITINKKSAVNQIIIGIGITGALLLAILFFSAIISLIWKRCRSVSNYQDPSSNLGKNSHTNFNPDDIKKEPVESAQQILYEEIDDPPSTSNCTKCPAYAATTEVCHHEYEDINSYSRLSIKLTPCSAYGEHS